MIDYGSFGRPPRRRRGGVLLAAAVFGVVLVLGGVAVVVMILGRTAGPAAASSSPGQPPSDTSGAANLTLGACIDPTLSSVSSFAPAIRGDLAQAIGSLAPPAGALPTNSISGGAVSSPQAGVNLTVRQVDTTSLSSAMGAYTRTVTVPPVPGLARSRPAPGSRDYLSRLRTWSVAYDAVAAARRSARSAATAGGATIAGMALDRRGMSDIAACVSGLLTTVPPDGSHSYLLSSDLQQNQTPQLAGSFHGAPLVIIQSCDSGSAAYCQHLLSRFTRLMRQLDAGRITVVRPERAAAAINQWISTGEVTP